MRGIVELARKGKRKYEAGIYGAEELQRVRGIMEGIQEKSATVFVSKEQLLHNRRLKQKRG